MVAADKYAVFELFKKCEAKLVAKVNSDNMVEVVLFNRLMKSDVLTRPCAGHLNCKNIRNAKHYKQLYQYPDVLDQSFATFPGIHNPINSTDGECP